jgi:hypothetical protein
VTHLQLFHARQAPLAFELAEMDAMTAFGFAAVTLMVVAYALEDRSPWWLLVFAVACALASTYGFLTRAWPFAAVEAVWSLVALRRARGRFLSARAARRPAP